MPPPACSKGHCDNGECCGKAWRVNEEGKKTPEWEDDYEHPDPFIFCFDETAKEWVDEEDPDESYNFGCLKDMKGKHATKLVASAATLVSAVYIMA